MASFLPDGNVNVNKHDGNDKEEMIQSAESESEDPNSATAIALRIPWVLSSIGDYLPVKDLPTHRSISTAWNSALAPIMRTKWPMLTFDSDHKLYSYLATMNSSSCIPFGGYKLTTTREAPPPSPGTCIGFFVRQPIGLAATRLSLQISLLGSHGSGVARALRSIVFEWTPNLVELELFCDSYHHEEPKTKNMGTNTNTATEVILALVDAEQQQQCALRQLPALRKITLKIANVENTGPTRAILKFVFDLFRAAVRLDSFKATELRGNGLLKAALDGLVDSHGYGSLCLTNLSIGQASHAELRTLINLGARLRLTKLSYYDEEWEPDQELCRLLSQLLTLQARTLESLRIQTEEHSNPIWLPRCDRLVSFKIAGAFPVQFEAQTFASNFPALKTLMLRDNIEEAHPTFGHPSVSRLKFNLLDPDPEPDAALTEGLRTCFPCVVQVEVLLAHAGLLRLFWTIWPDLKVLRVDEAGEESDETLLPDEIITGIPRSQFRLLRQASRNGPEAVAEAQKNLGTLKTLPGISDLRELREFEWRSWGHGHGQGVDVVDVMTVTELSDHFGFQLPGSKLAVAKVNGIEHARARTTS